MTKTVMVIDDSPSIRALYGIAITNAGYRVVEAVDGQDAVDKLDGTDLHLVVSDLSMPRMDGISLLRHLRTHPRYKATPMMLVSTETRTAVKEEARRQGAQAFLSKPVSTNDLLAAVRRLCK